MTIIYRRFITSKGQLVAIRVISPLLLSRLSSRFSPLVKGQRQSAPASTPPSLRRLRTSATMINAISNTVNIIH
ncbi:hypothetical protein [Nostoc sp. C110]|uniref:hypothetical protein n=1 Tax=Nostoc sp. C110 TaxID=3349876 RepID=UPI00370D0FDC